jgi:hypothetical protein
MKTCPSPVRYSENTSQKEKTTDPNSRNSFHACSFQKTPNGKNIIPQTTDYTKVNKYVTF